MALKRKGCDESNEELLYVFEFFVDRLNLNCHSLRSNCSYPEDVLVRVSFLDLTPFDVDVQESTITTRKHCGNENENSIVEKCNLACSASCLFSKAPDDLIRAVRTTPLLIQVRHRQATSTCSTQKIICLANVPLPRCLCEYVASFSDTNVRPSTPYLVKNMYHLTDLKCKSAGHISVSLKLWCLGETMSRKILRQEPLVWRSKQCCGNDVEGNRRGSNNGQGILKAENGNNSNGRSSGISEDIEEENDNENRKGGSVEGTRSKLKRPSTPPRIAIDEPGFEDLTSAEKLNDPQYRGIVYSCYPDEPTCSCRPPSVAKHPLACRGGCTRDCCMKLRNPETLYQKKEDHLYMPSHCVDSVRLRGGAGCEASDDNMQLKRILRLNGGGTEDYPMSTDVESSTLMNTEFNWYGERIQSEHRLAGGGETARTTVCACPDAPVTTLYKDPSVHFPEEQSACRPSQRKPSKAACICTGKEPTSAREDPTPCTKKPCSGIDCLLRTFQDLQDFVDSLGKVPGLEGLGLMDPSESPYFGRDLDKDYAPQEPPLAEQKRAAAANVHNPHCTAPCNTNPQASMPTTGMSTGSVPYQGGTPFTINVPGRTGVVREAVPVLPDSSNIVANQRMKRKEEKKKEREDEKAKEQRELDATISVPLDVDVGPCGEPRCKSRKKGMDIAAPSSDHLETMQKKSGTQLSGSQGKRGFTQHSRTKSVKSSERGRHTKGKSGSPGSEPRSEPRSGQGGDQSTLAKSPIKASKKIMRYVYTLGNVYPGLNIGHKTCIEPRIRVPANMGWLWNTNITIGKLKPRLGWRPGAIARFLYEMLKEAKLGSTLPDESRTEDMKQASRTTRSVPSTKRRTKPVGKSTSYTSVKKSQQNEIEEETESPPTLHIHRKDGTYYVTMYPIRQEIPDGVPRVDEPMKPLQFKIVKNKDDTSVASSSTASDMEIEFSPPAAVNRNRRKPDVVHADTQVRQQEILEALKTSDANKKKDKKVKKEKEVKDEEKESKKIAKKEKKLKKLAV